MFNMEFKFDKEMVKSVGEKAWRLTKKIGVKGAQALLLETVTNTLTASYEGGLPKVKEKLTFDGIVGPKPEKKPRKKLFSKKNKGIEEIPEVSVEKPEIEILEAVKAEDVKVEVIDKKKK